MKRRSMAKPVFRFLIVWVLTSVIIGAYAWFNIAVKSTPYWLDIVLGGVLLVILSRQSSVRQIAAALGRYRVLRWIIAIVGITVALAFFLRAIWGIQEQAWLTAQCTYGACRLVFDESNLTLSGVIYSLPNLVNYLEAPLVAASYVFALGNRTVLETIQYLAIPSLAWGIIAVSVSTLMGVVIERLLPKLLSKNQPKPWRMSKSIRFGRWRSLTLRILRWPVLVVVAIIVVPLLVAVATARPISWRPLLPPFAPSEVSQLLLDEQTGLIYAGTSSGLYRSKDGGENWVATNTGMPSTKISALALDGRDGALYVGTFDQGVYRSKDGGMNWVATNTGMTYTLVSALVLDEHDSTMYASMGWNGVYRSKDGGENWVAANTGMPNTAVLHLALDARDGTLYVGTFDQGVYRSKDGGESWVAANTGMTHTIVSALALDERDGTLYASMGWNGVYRSKDGGENWVAANTGMPNMTVLDLAVDARDGTLYAGTSDRGVYRSKDGGASWTLTSIDIASARAPALAQNRRDGTLYAGTDNGVYRSNDTGKTWAAISKGLPIKSASKPILTLDERDNTLYAITGSGMYRSQDNGGSWIAISAELPAASEAIALNGRDGTLYMNTYSGVFYRSKDGGESWVASHPGLPGIATYALALDGRDGMLYAGTFFNGVYKTKDGGESWVAANTGMTNTTVSALAVDGNNGTLYAATYQSGIYRSEDGGESWVATNGMTDTIVSVLVIDGRDGTLYAGTDAGVYRSKDDGKSWAATNMERPVPRVSALVLDGRDGALYAGMDGGVYRSKDGGKSWVAMGAVLPDISVKSLTMDRRNGTLFVGTNYGIYQSKDGGASWVENGPDLPNVRVPALAMNEQDRILYAVTDSGRVYMLQSQSIGWEGAPDEERSYQPFLGDLELDQRDGTLYRVTNGGIYRSKDAGMSWVPAKEKFSYAYFLLLDARSNTLYADTNEGVYQSKDGGTSWEMASATPLDLSGDYGLMFKSPNGDLRLATSSGGLLWGKFARQEDSSFPSRALMYTSNNGNTEVLRISGPMLVRAELPNSFVRIPGALLVTTDWLIQAAFWIVPLTALIALIFVISRYASVARPFSIPLWAMLFAPRRQVDYASVDRLNEAWSVWEKMVSDDLRFFGDVTTDDIWRIPATFRSYALHRYAQSYGQSQNLETQPDRLRLLVGDRVQRWHQAWNVAARDLSDSPGLTAKGKQSVDKLMGVLGEALGLNVHVNEVRDIKLVRGYQVEAPVLRLRIPLRFPVLFVADLKPGDHTVQTLVDAVDVLKETDYFAWVIPLEPKERQIDLADQLRRAIERSNYPHDLIVVSQADVLDMLMARQPDRIVAQLILRQRDLSVISPFVISGPVRETMFFGRDAEIKTLYDMAGRADFAIIGNRKIGKTSLLQRARAKIETASRVQLLAIDCQAVRDAARFFEEVQDQANLPLPSPTPRGFATAVRERAALKPVVFLLDEVDALLANEKTQGEPLVATWRQLAQAGECHFVFCGSTGLARRLKDKGSAFFNFAQPMTLSYLSAEIARQVLEQPLETLGIELEDREALVSEAVDLTSGHPNFVQYLGRELVNAANRRHERRILLSDLAAVRASNDFVDYFIRTVWGEAGPLEKLITLVAPFENFQAGEVEDALTRHGVTVSSESVDEALDMLCIYAILEKQGRQYRFIPRHFPEMLHQTQEIERLINQERGNLNQAGVQ